MLDSTFFTIGIQYFLPFEVERNSSYEMLEFAMDQMHIQSDLFRLINTLESNISFPFSRVSMVMISMILFGWIVVVERMFYESANEAVL
jgi:hypothetical protein